MLLGSLGLTSLLRQEQHFPQRVPSPPKPSTGSQCHILGPQTFYPDQEKALLKLMVEEKLWSLLR